MALDNRCDDDDADDDTDADVEDDGTDDGTDDDREEEGERNEREVLMTIMQCAGGCFYLNLCLFSVFLSFSVS